MGKNRGASRFFSLIRKDNREFYDRWCEKLISGNYSPLTINKYQNTMQIFLSWNYEHNGDKLLTDFRNRDYTSYVAYVRGTLGSSPRRTNFHKTVLTNISAFIEKDYEDAYPEYRNRARNIDSLPSSETREKVIVSPDELVHMLDTLVRMEKYQLACWLAILAYSGCRRSEGIQIKVEWLTEAYEVFPAPYTMYKTPPMRTKGRGKEGKVIPKYIFKDQVKPYLDLWLAERERLGIQSEWLFVSPVLDKPNDSTATSFALAIRKIFNNGFHNHCMRHYFATMLRSMHFPDSIIQKIVRWNDAEMIDRYDDTSEDVAIEEYYKSRKETEQ